MFCNLEKYLQHRASKSCRKRQAESQDVTSDDGGSPSQVPEVVHVRNIHLLTQKNSYRNQGWKK
jgi:hypothetical protein